MATHMVPYNRAPGTSGVADFTEVVNPFHEFYGPNDRYSSEAFNPEDAQRHRAYDLPEAYKGKNIYIPKIIMMLVTSKDTWYAKASPFELTDQLHYTHETIIFDDHLPVLTPYKAPSRIVTSRKESMQGSLVRRGIAFMMEHDFMNTPEGREYYAYTLTQMSNAILSQHKIDVMISILQATNFADNWQQRYGFTSSQNVLDQLEMEKRMWAILQRKKKAAHELDVTVNQWLKDADANLNNMAWIVHPRAMAWLELVPKENTDYWIGGPGVTNDQEDSSKPMRRLAGVPAYAATVKDTDEFRNGNPLERQREIGNYYTMIRSDEQRVLNQEYPYKSSHGTIRIYDEDIDDWSYITLSTALENSSLFDSEGNITAPTEGDSWMNDFTGSSGGGGGGGGNSPNAIEDFLTYKNDTTGEVKNVTRFGHMDAKHSSTASIVDICKGLVNHVSLVNKGKKEDMDVIINKAMQLYRELRQIPVTQEWLTNVVIQNLLEQSGGTLYSLMSKYADILKNVLLTGDSYAQWTADLKQFLRLQNNDRMSVPLVVFSTPFKGALSLPQRNWTKLVSENVNQFNRVYGSQVEIQMNNSRVAGDGGEIIGALCGYASWDGFLTLQREYKSSAGGGSTKGGYSLDSCKIASDFVELVEDLVTQLKIVLGSDSPYFDENLVSSQVDNPTPQHAIAEWLLGMSGLPLWLNPSTVAILAGFPGNGVRPELHQIITKNKTVYHDEKEIDRYNGISNRLNVIIQKLGQKNDYETELHVIFGNPKIWNNLLKNVQNSQHNLGKLNPLLYLGTAAYSDEIERDIAYEKICGILDVVIELLSHLKDKRKLQSTMDALLNEIHGHIFEKNVDIPLASRSLESWSSLQNFQNIFKKKGNLKFNTLVNFIYKTLVNDKQGKKRLEDRYRILNHKLDKLTSKKEQMKTKNVQRPSHTRHGIPKGVQKRRRARDNPLNDLFIDLFEYNLIEVIGYVNEYENQKNQRTQRKQQQQQQQKQQRQQQQQKPTQQSNIVDDGSSSLPQLQEGVQPAAQLQPQLQSASVIDNQFLNVVQDPYDKIHQLWGEKLNAPKMNILFYDSLKKLFKIDVIVESFEKNFMIYFKSISKTISENVDPQFLNANDGLKYFSNTFIEFVDAELRKLDEMFNGFDEETIQNHLKEQTALMQESEQLNAYSSSDSNSGNEDENQNSGQFWDINNQVQKDFNVEFGGSKPVDIGSRITSEEDSNKWSETKRKKVISELFSQNTFFRSSLVLSADQIQSLCDNMSESGSYEGIVARISDPHDNEIPLDKPATKRLLDDIIRTNRSQRPEDRKDPFAPSYMYFTKNIQTHGFSGASLLKKFDDIEKRQKNGPPRRSGSIGNTSNGGGNGVRSRFHENDDDHSIGHYGKTKKIRNRSIAEDFSYDDVWNPIKEHMGINRYLLEDYKDFNSIIIKNILGIYAEGYGPLINVIACIYLSSKMNKNTLRNMIHHNIPLPMGFLVLQPHKRYTMAMGIKMRFDKDTAKTFFGHTNMQLMDDGKIKVHWGHWTYHSRSVFLNPRNLFHAYDIFCLAALGGSGTLPIDPGQYSFSEAKTGGAGSLIFAAVPAEQRKFPTVMDIKGKFSYAGTAIDPDNLSGPHYDTCERYSKLWGWYGRAGAGTQAVLNLPDYGNAEGFVNTVVFQGQQFAYNYATRDYTTKITNKGHWGEVVQPGVKDIYNGGFVDFRSLVGLEIK